MEIKPVWRNQPRHSVHLYRYYPVSTDGRSYEQSLVEGGQTLCALLVYDFAVQLYPFGVTIECRKFNGVVLRCKFIINAVSIGSHIKGLREKHLKYDVRQKGGLAGGLGAIVVSKAGDAGSGTLVELCNRPVINNGAIIAEGEDPELPGGAGGGGIVVLASRSSVTIGSANMISVEGGKGENGTLCGHYEIWESPWIWRSIATTCASTCAILCA